MRSEAYPWDNACIESFHSRIKREWLNRFQVRECQEELTITLSVGDEFMEVVHEYPDITLRLTLFQATIAESTPQKPERNDIRWSTVDEIPKYEFCPADMKILRRIKHVCLKV